MPFQNSAARDFRLQAGAAAIDYGSRVFVPWALYDTVGEWHFRLNKKNPGKITDEQFNMKPWYDDRQDYHTLRRNHLTVSGATAGDFVSGVADTWCKSALTFDGTMSGAITPSGTGGPLVTDMGTNNFVIETIFKTVPGHTYGALVSKVDIYGYILDIDNQGHIRVRLWNGGVDTFVQDSSVAINDGKWHHVLVDIERSHPHGCKIYVDGARADLPPTGFVPNHSQDLTASAGLSVGSALGAFYFQGAIEFLRIAKGNLADAKTTFEELYEWEFNGPQYYDFRGVPAYGARDAGAFEYEQAGPAFVQQPKDVTTDILRDATFRVFTGNATGHQWCKDGGPIAGATGTTLVVEDAAWPDQGDYFCVASGAGVSVTSDWASLTVVPEPGGAGVLLAALWLGRRAAGRG
jgi:hypothetical protein